MLLLDLLYKTGVKSIHGNTDKVISGVQTDSRKISAGELFVAVRGKTVDGHNYIKTAEEKGAIAIICEELPETLSAGVTYVEVYDTSKALGEVSHLYFGEPSLGIKVVGVTGTNGKTTVATLLHQLFTALGHTCGLISTVQYVIGKEVYASTHTTPDALSLASLLRKMKDKGCTHVFMECSSHAIDQHRITGIDFTGAIFTNITHDHLDYHGTFDEYIRVKKHWFDTLTEHAFALSNADDKRGAVMLQNTRAGKYYYSLKQPVQFKGKVLDNSLQGLLMLVNDREVQFRLIGEFNAYNLLAVYGAAVLMGEQPEEILLALSNANGAEGRFDHIKSKDQRVMGIIDYAHTPDALLNVLHTIKNLKAGNKKLITVVGCGGNRDKAKRPLMARAATEHSDKVILTSDNPRNEEPQDILKEMEEGVELTKKKKVITVTDRKEAIKTAVSLAEQEDIILIAGKGHEKYQEIKGVKYPFDDKEILMEVFELLEK